MLYAPNVGIASKTTSIIYKVATPAVTSLVRNMKGKKDKRKKKKNSKQDGKLSCGICDTQLHIPVKTLKSKHKAFKGNKIDKHFHHVARARITWMKLSFFFVGVEKTIGLVASFVILTFNINHFYKVK